MNINRLNWNHLRVFLVLARTGSLSQAGRLLGIDHATAGRRISALEHDMGTPLFERDHTGYRVNAHGRLIFEHVASMEASVLAAASQLGGGEVSPSGIVRIATMEGIASLYLSEQFARFKRTTPDIVIELVTSSRDVRVTHREADVFLGFFQPPGKNLHATKIGEFGCHLYGSHDYFARCGTPASVADLSKHQFAGYIDELIQLDIVRWLEEGVANPTYSFHSSSMLSQMFAAAAGAGLVMLPAFSRPERFGLHPVLLDEINVRREVWMSTLVNFQRLPRINAVLSFLTATFARDYPA
ncbi:LysR family transcriptional regulator [Burkholderia plantarii]|uniref:LysR family transcriptional regulator n=1 Tax=Burkholderia plantarii TaxID=41899 RepID=UPI0006D8AC1B|nr:LysR family transcriptional regulator [Burkholderia plantarii]ALK35190.1 Transcriptional regulator, LysR family [Burkholderia plantarii]WLE64146.1 LysR family transcriptional regulator [Burkholderia plantarii]